MSETFEWQGKIRGTVAEMNRAAFFDFHVAIQPYLTQTSSDYIKAVDDLLVALTPVRLEVCVDGKWKPISKSFAVGNGIDAFTLTSPMTMEAVAALPVSLFVVWNAAALQVNGYLRNLFLAPVSSPTTTVESSGSPSDSAPSDEQPLTT